MKTKEKRWSYFLILALAAYVIKNFFVGADADEGYAVVLGYRFAMGDRLLLEMWEPHQTSAIFTGLLMKPFLWNRGENLDFLTLYLRVFYFVIHGSIAWLVYRTVRKCAPQVDQKGALGLALVYFVSSPKSIYIPEYSNLNVWFFALLCVSLFWYYSETSPLRGKLLLLVAAGLALTCDVLAYPSMAILFPFCFCFLAWKQRQKGWKQCLAFTTPCVLSATVLMGYILSYMSFEQIMQVIPHIMSDGSHQTSFWEKLKFWFSSFGDMACVLLISAVVAFVAAKLFCRLHKKRKTEEEKEIFGIYFLIAFFIMQIVFQFYFWFTSLYNASYPQLTYLAVTLVGIYCYYKSGKKEKMGFYIILLSLIQYFGVIMLSNWEPMQVVSYMVVGAIGGFLCWNTYFMEYSVKWKEQLLHILCGLLVISNVFGYCYLIIGGSESNSPIWEISGYSRDGFRKGILTGYMASYRYNMNNEIWEEAVPDGSTLLYVGPLQFYSMFGECTIASPNTISTPMYDENLLAYWEMNPDRYPDIVVIESWFGKIDYVDEDSFIMKWLEEEFCATEIIEYPYITVYKK